MFPTTGLFKDISCPYFLFGLCERPFCHFKHSRHEEAKARAELEKASLSKVENDDEYKPPTTSLQRTLQEIENSIQSEKRKLGSQDEPEEKSVKKGRDIIKNKPTGTPEYNPTPLCELKKKKKNETLGKSKYELALLDGPASEGEYDPASNFATGSKHSEEYVPSEVQQSESIPDYANVLHGVKRPAGRDDDDESSPLAKIPKFVSVEYTPTVNDSVEYSDEEAVGVKTECFSEEESDNDSDSERLSKKKSSSEKNTKLKKDESKVQDNNSFLPIEFTEEGFVKNVYVEQKQNDKPNKESGKDKTKPAKKELDSKAKKKLEANIFSLFEEEFDNVLDKCESSKVKNGSHSPSEAKSKPSSSTSKRSHSSDSKSSDNAKDKSRSQHKSDKHSSSKSHSSSSHKSKHSSSTESKSNHVSDRHKNKISKTSSKSSSSSKHSSSKHGDRSDRSSSSLDHKTNKHVDHKKKSHSNNHVSNGKYSHGSSSKDSNSSSHGNGSDNKSRKDKTSKKKGILSVDVDLFSCGDSDVDGAANHHGDLDDDELADLEKYFIEDDPFDECFKIFNEENGNKPSTSSAASEKKKQKKIDDDVPSAPTGKKRVALKQSSNDDVKRKVVSDKPAPRPSPAQVMMNRYKMMQEKALLAEQAEKEKLKEKVRKMSKKKSDKTPTGTVQTKPSLSSASATFTTYMANKNKKTTAITVTKGGKRKAHTPTVPIAKLKRPTVEISTSSKVAANVRQRYLNLFIDECLKIYSTEEEAFKKGKEEEEAVYKRCSNKNIYLNFAVNTIKRLRTAAEQKTSGSKSSTPQKKLSHASMLDGAGATKTTYTLHRSGGAVKIQEEDYEGAELYKRLQPYVLTPEQLKENNFPHPDPDVGGQAVFYGEQRNTNQKGSTKGLLFDGPYQILIPNFLSAIKVPTTGLENRKRKDSCQVSETDKQLCEDALKSPSPPVFTETIADCQLEWREGVTYESGKASDEVSYYAEIPSATQKPVQEHMSNLSGFTKIFCDLETTSLDKFCDLTQLAATCGEQSFDRYILPSQPISLEASMITGLTVCNDTMYYKEQQVETSSLDETLRDFLLWLDQMKPCVLVGHNFKRFDFPRLARAFKSCKLLNSFKTIVSGVVDTLPLYKKLYPELRSHSQFRIVDFVLKKNYSAHNALADVKILEELVNVSTIPDEFLIQFSYSMEYLVQKYNYDVNFDSLNILIQKKIFSSYLGKRVAETGLNLDHIKLAVSHGGLKGLSQLFRENVSGKPRVTKSQSIIEKVYHFVIESYI